MNNKDGLADRMRAAAINVRAAYYKLGGDTLIVKLDTALDLLREAREEGRTEMRLLATDIVTDGICDHETNSDCEAGECCICAQDDILIEAARRIRALAADKGDADAKS